MDNNEPEAWRRSQLRQKLILSGGIFGAMFFTVTAPLIWPAPIAKLGLFCLPVFLFGSFGVYAQRISPLKCRRTRVLTASLPAEQGFGIAMSFGRPQVVAHYALYAATTALLVSVPFLAGEISGDGGRRSGWFHLIAPLTPLVALGFAVYLISPLIRKRRKLGIGLSAEGVYNWSWLGCCFFKWEWISEIRASGQHGPDIVINANYEPSERPVNAEENWVAGFDRFRQRQQRIHAGYLEVNPTVAYAALRYYLKYPDRRAELGTEAGVRRISQLDFPGIHA